MIIIRKPQKGIGNSLGFYSRDFWSFSVFEDFEEFLSPYTRKLVSQARKRAL